MAAVTALTGSGPKEAKAHVAPSVNENNRYIKLTVFADRVRLSYVIYIGEIPGQVARRRLDTDDDGTVSPPEADRFANEWAVRTAGALSIEIGGEPVEVRWSAVDIGLGDPRTSAGAFSVDLIAWLCPGEGPLELTLRDRLAVPSPGESALSAEESPGTEIARAELAGMPGTQFDWTGSDDVLERGFELEWRADADAPRDPSACSEAEPATRGSWRWWPFAAGGAALAAALALLVWRRRRVRRR